MTEEERFAIINKAQRQLLVQLDKTCKHNREVNRLTGSDFNIFKIVNVIDDEVRHSAFLAELLNPKGSHGQGAIFLNHFTKVFEIENFHSETAKVVPEKYIGQVTETEGGLIDIFIDDQHGNFIAIENKIYADDQDNQLIRYYRIKQPNQYYLFYLTLKEKMPHKRSYINEKLGIKLEEGKEFKLKSYKNHILPWLKLCLKEAVTIPLLREGILHYINLINYLTEETTNKAMSKEIVELVTESPDNLSNAKELVKSWNNVKAKVLWTFFLALKEALIIQGVEIDDLKETVTEEKTLNIYEKNFSEKIPRFGLLCPVYKRNDIVIRWACMVDQNIHFGFKIWDNGKPANDAPENAWYKKIITINDINYSPSQNWLSGYQYTNPKLDFYNFKSDAIFSLVDKNELDKTVQIIAEKAYADISFAKSELAKYEQDNLK